MEAKKRRLEYVDVAKGIGIICIILGHLGLASVNKVVFTFYVPIFFLITGYFTNSNRSTNDFIKNKVRTLIVPYFITSAVIIILGTLEGMGEGNAKIAFSEWLCAALYGAGDTYTTPFYIRGIGAIWFLWATFWGSIFLRISLKFHKLIRIVFVIGLFILGRELKKWFWFPLSIQAGACATLFMYIGYLFRQSEEKLKKISEETRIFCAFFALGVWISFIRQFQSFWLVNCDFGRGIIDIFGSVCACACVLMFSRIVEWKMGVIAKIIAFFGKYSIFILCIHITELNLLKWWEMTAEYGISSKYQLPAIIIGKFILDLGGAWLLSRIKFVKKIFGMK